MRATLGVEPMIVRTAAIPLGVIRLLRWTATVGPITIRITIRIPSPLITPIPIPNSMTRPAARRPRRPMLTPLPPPSLLLNKLLLAGILILRVRVLIRRLSVVEGPLRRLRRVVPVVELVHWHLRVVCSRRIGHGGALELEDLLLRLLLLLVEVEAEAEDDEEEHEAQEGDGSYQQEHLQVHLLYQFLFVEESQLGFSPDARAVLVVHEGLIPLEQPPNIGIEPTIVVVALDDHGLRLAVVVTFLSGDLLDIE